MSTFHTNTLPSYDQSTLKIIVLVKKKKNQRKTHIWINNTYAVVMLIILLAPYQIVL
jgi:hypothetical protein